MVSHEKDARCEFCKDLVWDKSWELHEVQPNLWMVVCGECDEATGLSEGK